MSKSGPPISGTVAPGFEPVRDVFERNFTQRGELGAAVAAYHERKKIVDLWGRYRDVSGTTPWTADTLVLVFSTTKGIAAAGMAHAHSAGLFEYEDQVAEYWPAFGTHGKEDITIRQLLAHQGGIAAIDGKLTPGDIADRESFMRRLATKEPDWEPGTRHGYHAFSLGWYESELLRRADPAGRRLPTYVEEEILAPLNAEFYIGLPDECDTERVADIEPFGALDLVRNMGSFPPRLLLSLMNPWSLSTRSLSPFDMSTPAELNDLVWQTLEIPAGNGIGRVRDIAKLYGALATGGKCLGIDGATYNELTSQPGTSLAGRTDMVLKTETSYALGYWKPFDGFSFGSTMAFGAPGAGGSFAFADPDRGLGFAYAPNRMGTHIWDDPREYVLREAVLNCLDAA